MYHLGGKVYFPRMHVDTAMPSLIVYEGLVEGKKTWKNWEPPLNLLIIPLPFDGLIIGKYHLSEPFLRNTPFSAGTRSGPGPRVKWQFVVSFGLRLRPVEGLPQDWMQGRLLGSLHPKCPTSREFADHKKNSIPTS